MGGFKFPSRNRKSNRDDIIVCPHCKKKYNKDDLIEDTEDEMHDYYMFMNEMIVHCDCEMGDFTPNMIDIMYKYSGRCKRRDGK